MQKWEYCTIFMFSSSAKEVIKRGEAKQVLSEAGIDKTEDFLVYSTEKGKEKPNVNVDNLHNTLAKLGMEGWELVSHTQKLTYAGTLVPITEEYIFKRPIEQEGGTGLA